jgi:hypothetical protein
MNGELVTSDGDGHAEGASDHEYRVLLFTCSNVVASRPLYSNIVAS